MERGFRYRLNDPRYTLYHRAALGGLAATVQAWDKKTLAGIHWELDSTTLCLTWEESLTDQDALRRVLEASFGITKDKLIDLPGLGLDDNHNDLRAVIHNGLCGTFLQHNKMRPGEKTARTLPLLQKDDGQQLFVTYKGVHTYAHRTAQGTKLLDSPKLPERAVIPQSLIPGATKGAAELTAPPDEVFLLLYLMVASPVFLIRSRGPDDKAQYAIVVPDVTDLEAFAEALRNTVPNRELSSSSYGGRVAGGGEEAALRFLLDLEAGKLSHRGHGVEKCHVIVMGKVAWDKNQINRSQTRTVRKSYPEMGVYRAANEKGLGAPVPLPTKKSNEVFFVPKTPIPALFASNLAAEKRDGHWLDGFSLLVSEQKDFRHLMRADIREGLRAVKSAIHNELDRLVIDVFHEAWRRRLAVLAERARREQADFFSLVEGEQEKNRNQILRLRTSEGLANWFLTFCSSVTRGAPLKAWKGKQDAFLNFLLNPRHAERLQNLLLFAMLTYEGSGEEKADESTIPNKE